MAVIVRVDHLEGEDLTLLARPEAGGSTLFQGEVSAATLKVYEKGSDTAVLDKTLLLTGNPTGADDECMFDSAAGAQTDDGWTLDGGYTFVGFVRDSEYHLDGGKQYRVEVALTAGHTAPTWPQQLSYGDLLYVWWVNVIPTASA